jgi:putative hydrolase of the HAD superfamily
LDGTLLDDESATWSALEVFYAAHHGSLDLQMEQLQERWASLVHKHFGRYLRGELSMLEQRRERMRELFGGRLTAEDADLRFSVYERAYTQSWRAFPDVMPALAALRGRRLAVLTNGHAEQQRAKLQATNLAGQFEQVFISSEIGSAKPDPAAFRHACARLGLTEGDCLFVGDDPEADIRGAMAAGMRALWLDRRRQGKEKGLSTIHSLLEIRC